MEHIGCPSESQGVICSSQEPLNLNSKGTESTLTLCYDSKTWQQKRIENETQKNRSTYSETDSGSCSTKPCFARVGGLRAALRAASTTVSMKISRTRRMWPVRRSYAKINEFLRSMWTEKQHNKDIWDKTHVKYCNRASFYDVPGQIDL